MSTASIPFRLALQQRVFPAYRAPFFDALAESCAGGMSVFSGEPMPDEALGMEGALAQAERVQAHNLYLGWGPFLTVWQLRIINWLARWQPDVLIADTNPRNASTNAAIRWMHARRRPVIGWGLGAPAYSPGPLAGWLNTSRRRFLSQFDALISYSQQGKDEFTAAGAAPERIFIAPNAATPRPSQPPIQRSEQYVSTGPVVLFVGRLQSCKRVDALLRACARLPESLRPCLKIVGEGPARAELEAEAQKVFPSAQFCGDQRAEELARLFREADLFVLPGTGGLAVQQAMSFALPVIVAEADGTQGTLVRPENGWLLPPGDEEALAESLKDALSDPARLRRMGRESYRIVFEEANLERMVEVFSQVVAFVTDPVRGAA